jgi:hypothetical protein
MSLIQIKIEQVSHEIFLMVLSYLYTDYCEITLENAMELFEAADIFGLDRLKNMCESAIISNIDIDNAAAIFHVRIRDQRLRTCIVHSH